MRVERTLVQTLASQLSSTLTSFDRRMKVERTLVQTLASQLSSTLTSFDRRMNVERALVQTLASRLASSFDQAFTSISEGSKSSTHYQSDTNRLDVSSKGPSSGISVITNSTLIVTLLIVTLIPDEGPLLETANLFVSLR